MIESDDADTLLSPGRGLNEIEDCCIYFITFLSSTAIEWNCHCCTCLLCLISSCTMTWCVNNHCEFHVPCCLTIRLQFPSLSSITMHCRITVIIARSLWSLRTFLVMTGLSWQQKIWQEKNQKTRRHVAVDHLWERCKFELKKFLYLSTENFLPKSL